MDGMNHNYEYQTEFEPNRFWFTPDQVARCCLEHGRAKDSKRTVRGVATQSIDGLVIIVTVTKALVESSCRTDVGTFHGNSADDSKDNYVHSDDGSLLIEIYEPPLRFSESKG